MSKSLKSSKGAVRPYSNLNGEEDADPSFAPSTSTSIPLLTTDHTFHEDMGDLPTYDQHLATPAVNALSAIVVDHDPNAPPGFSEYYPAIVESSSGSVTSYDAHLNNDGEALYRFLLQQNKRPPRPFVRMWGTHTETKRTSDGKSERKVVTDFDMRVDMSEALMLSGGDNQPGLMRLAEPGELVYRGGKMRSLGRAIEVGTKDWRGWIDEYCAHTSSAKEFRMTKVCPGYDENFLKQKLYSLIQSTNYRGTIQIAFNTDHSKVTVRPANRLTSLRYNAFIRWFFYLTCLWILAWPILWFITHRYEVVHSVWPMSITNGSVRSVKVSEEEWYGTWRGAIRNAVIAKRMGWVTEEDLDAYAASVGNTGPVRTGNVVVDGVLGAVGIFSQAQQVRGWGGEREYSY